MALTDRDLFNQWAAGALSSRRGEFSDLDTELKRVFRRRVVSIPLPADGSAGATTAETVVYQVPAAVFANGATLIEAKICETATITGHASNYATLTLSNRDGAGGGAVSMATFVTNATPSKDLVAMTPTAMTLSGTPANLVIPAGGVVTYQVAKASSGVQLVAGTIELTLEAV